MKNVILLIIFSTSLFLFLLPLQSKITFSQNDDYVYYKMVENFSNYDFKLDPYTAANFYTQGIIALIFIKLFSLDISSLPLLTLFFHVLCFYVFARIIFDFLKKDLPFSILSSLIFSFNPIVRYSSLGFMTETYNLFFFLMVIYFSISFLERQKKLSFVLLNIFGLLGFFIRQTSILPTVSFLFVLFYRKQFRWAIMQSLIIFLTLFYQYFIFPRTPVMYDGSLEFSNLFNFKFLMENFIAVFILLSSFCLPFVIMFLYDTFKVKKTTIVKTIIFLFISILLFSVLKLVFDHEYFPLRQFPYFGNVFERKGFFPRDILSEKYHFAGIEFLYNTWELLGKVLVSLLIPAIIIYFNRRKFYDESVSLLVLVNLFASFGLFLITPVIYDRYTIVFYPLFILLLVSITNFHSKIYLYMLFTFAFFMIFLTRMYSLDFVLTNEYIWQKANQLTISNNIEKNEILSTNAWNKLYGYPSNGPLYLFSYDYNYKRDTYILYDMKEINFPFNLFISPKIYLYQRNY